MSRPRPVSRRQFAFRAAAAAASLTIVPRRVLGGPGHTPPSDTLTKAVVGVGGMGREHLRYAGAVLRAVCDVDRSHLESALEMAGPDVAGYTDFREVLDRPDIDIVHVATPPHWHGLVSLAAVLAGKDVWCEKPMTRTIAEGRALADAVERTGRMFRVNTWFRFRERFYRFGTEVKPVKKAVQAGLLGWPIKATVSAATGFDWKSYWTGLTSLAPEPVPAELDYDFWLGPAPVKPYNRHRVHQTFRGYWDYDGGGLGDMGMHYLDPVQYVLGKDDTSPVEVWADAPQQHPDACGTWRRIEMRYADGCAIVLDGENRDEGAPFLEGPRGSIYRGLRSDIPGLPETVAALPDPEVQIIDFAESVRTRRRFALNERNGHRSCTLVNLGKIAVQLGRRLRYDPVAERFVDDDEANRLVDQPMRSPWRLPG
jgi:predicted dehydrogenase